MYTSRRALKVERSTKKETDTSKQQAEFLEKGTNLRRRIQTWRKVQVVYQPYLASDLETSDPPEIAESSSELPENMELNLPSSIISQSEVRGSRAGTRLVDMEIRLRKAQADDALADIRRLRRAIQGGWTFKQHNLAGQGNKPNTRLRATLNRLNSKVDKAAEKYRSARDALSALNPNGSWNATLRPLAKSDLTGPAKEADQSNRDYMMSWIWTVQHSSNEPLSTTAAEKLEVDETLRVEWMKARARHRRWEEELKLVLEEMRRVIAYFEWKANWWLQQSSLRQGTGQPVTEADIISGLNAYASKQSALLLCLAESCRKYWLPSVTKHKISIPWTPSSARQGSRVESTALFSESPNFGPTQPLLATVTTPISHDMLSSSNSQIQDQVEVVGSEISSDESSDAEGRTFDEFELGD